jgi:hypothetical protein
MFLDSDRCRQLFTKASEIRKILGDEKVAILEKCMRDNELNQGYQFNKLLSLCTKEQKETLLTLHLLDLDREKVLAWLELMRYVE